MKTAMQELLEFAKAHQELCNMNAKKCKDKVLKKQLETGVTSYTFVIIEAKKLIAKEKLQIETAFDCADDQILITQEEIYDGSKTLFNSGNDYFVKTFA